MSHGGVPVPPSALSSGDHRLHAQTQVQSGGQETRALETLVPVTAGLHTPLYYAFDHIFKMEVRQNTMLRVHPFTCLVMPVFDEDETGKSYQFVFLFPPFGTLWMRVLNLVWKYRSQL